jgi:hypothetical protein
LNSADSATLCRTLRIPLEPELPGKQRPSDGWWFCFKAASDRCGHFKNSAAVSAAGSDPERVKFFVVFHRSVKRLL